MIRIIDCPDPREAEVLIGREGEELVVVDDVVKEILDDVKKEGDAALIRFTKKLDGVELTDLKVSEAEIKEAVDIVGQDYMDVLKRAGDNIFAFHQKQKQNGFVMSEQEGIILGQKITPLDRVGVYVPGGTAAYSSTVLMDIIPALIAGVSEILMVTPPGKDGKINPAILAAAKTLGIDNIFKVGGAQAVAALAYGTQSIARVDKIVGPGNIYVATAKRMVYGLVDIDMIAGPSEILIIADDSADPKFVAMDLLSQAEHDKLAAAILVTTSRGLAENVQEVLGKYLKKLSRREIAEYSIKKNGAILLTDSLENAAKISNEIAPEHLEICTEAPFELVSSIKHAGSIFLGHYSPEALGDYFAGPNHTLPTGGTARFSSPLSVDDFIKKSSFISYSKEAFKKAYRDVETFARSEGLDAHADSAVIRFSDDISAK